MNARDLAIAQQIMLNSTIVLAKLWHDGYINAPDHKPVWGINDECITVGDIRKARQLLGMSIERKQS